MKSLLLVADPMGGSTSVQYDLLSGLCTNLRSRYRVSIYTPYCDAGKLAHLESGGCHVYTPTKASFPLNRALQLSNAGSESMLWAESWIREATLGKNSWEADRTLGGTDFDYTVNLSMTVPTRSDLWWILGTPIDQTIDGMAGTNLVADIVRILGSRLMARMDAAVMHRIQSRTRRIAANSPYLLNLHRARGVKVEGVVYTLTDISDFRPDGVSPSRDYVLLYLGKETELIDFERLKGAGVRIVAFGNKIPVGSRFSQVRNSVDFYGRVSREMLVALYSNALFPLFPFTCEPMGLVPIESMACGTPVLTYNRQGPASTVLDGKTGWLVESREQMVARAIELWQQGVGGIRPETCMTRAQEFTVQRSVDELIRWIEGPSRLPMERSVGGNLRPMATPLSLPGH